jgi:hypothetical protein
METQHSSAGYGDLFFQHWEGALAFVFGAFIALI